MTTDARRHQDPILGMLRQLRTQLGSQERVARELDVSYSAVSRWFRGESYPHPMVRGRIRQLAERVGREGHERA